MRKVFHVGDSGLGGRIRYFSTVDLVTSMPTFRSSPTIRGDPHVGFARHMSRINLRTSLAIAGRPGVRCWLKPSNGRESAAVARQGSCGVGQR